jgi:hypothetical protein
MSDDALRPMGEDERVDPGDLDPFSDEGSEAWARRLLDYCALVIQNLPESQEKREIVDLIRKSPEVALAEAQVDSMLDHIAPQERLDDLNGKLTQVSNWLAGSVPERHDMRAELEEIINRHSAENGSDTPDFILAEYLTGCLMAYDRALKAREEWYGRRLTKESHGAVEPQPTENPDGDES